MFSCTYIPTKLYTYIHTYITHQPIYIHIYIHTYIPTNLYTYLHTHQLTYMHTHIHTTGLSSASKRLMMTMMHGNDDAPNHHHDHDENNDQQSSEQEAILLTLDLPQSSSKPRSVHDSGADKRRSIRTIPQAQMAGVRAMTYDATNNLIWGIVIPPTSSSSSSSFALRRWKNQGMAPRSVESSTLASSSSSSSSSSYLPTIQPALRMEVVISSTQALAVISQVCSRSSTYLHYIQSRFVPKVLVKDYSPTYLPTYIHTYLPEP